MSRATRTTASQSAGVRSRLIVGLDVSTVDEARDLVEKLRGEVGAFKIGKQLFMSAGPAAKRACEMNETSGSSVSPDGRS